MRKGSLGVRVPLTQKYKSLFLDENSLVVQWLGLRAFTTEGAGSIPGQGTKIPQATRRNQNKKKTTKNKPKVCF